MDQRQKTPCVQENAECLLIDSSGVPYTMNKEKDDSESDRETPHNCGDKKSIVCTNKKDCKDKNTNYSKKGKLFKCTVCGKPFKWPSHLRHHMRSHTNERPHKCSVCHKGFKDAHKLNRHQQIHPEFRKDMLYWKIYKCPICDKNFKYPSDLDKHNLIHSGEKPFKCPVCGAGFRRFDHLKRHNFVHTGDRPFKCSVCGKGFVEATEVLKHERIHTGDKPYQCTCCDKSFYHPRSLKEHTTAKHGLVGLQKTALFQDDLHYRMSASTEKMDHYPLSEEKTRTGQVSFECLSTESRPHEIVICLSDDESEHDKNIKGNDDYWKIY